MLITDIFNFLFFMDTSSLIVTIVCILLAVYVFAYISSSVNGISIDEHWDNNLTRYLIFLTVMLPVPVFLLAFKINPVLCLVGLFLFFHFVRSLSYLANGRFEDDNSFVAKLLKERQSRIVRRIALKKASYFLKPYRNIMGKQILSNKYCHLSYNPDMSKFPRYKCLSKEKNINGEFYCFEAYLNNDKKVSDEFFNSVCFNFSDDTKLENLYPLFQKFDFIIFNSNYDVQQSIGTENASVENNETSRETLMRTIKEKEKEILSKDKAKDKIKNIQIINVNEASEAELTALPGINIVMAKRIIQQRDIAGEFNSVDDFITYIKPKEHFEKQIRERVKANPLILNLNLKNCVSEERIVDLD